MRTRETHKKSVQTSVFKGKTRRSAVGAPLVHEHVYTFILYTSMQDAWVCSVFLFVREKMWYSWGRLMMFYIRTRVSPFVGARNPVQSGQVGAGWSAQARCPGISLPSPGVRRTFHHPAPWEPVRVLEVKIYYFFHRDGETYG